MPNPRGPTKGPFGDTPLARWLVGASSAPPTLEQARRATLSGVVAERVPDHPDHAELRRDAVATATRHLSVASEVRRLFRAWNAVGIVPCVFKGFHLAEFVYPSAALRVYHDVDTYVPPSRLADARAAALALGWTVIWSADERHHLRATRRAEYAGHEALELRHPGLGLKLDVHRRLAHNSHARVPVYGIQERLTAAVVSATLEVAWGDVRLRLLQPTDAVVLGLAVNRCWSADAWRIKPRDYGDFEALVVKHGLERRSVLHRATELGVRRTVAIYLRRCDAFERRLVLRAPGWRRHGWNLRVVPERGPHALIRMLVSLNGVVVDGPIALWTLARTWNLVRHAIRYLDSTDSATAWEGAFPIASGKPRNLTRTDWRTFVRAVHRNQRIARVALRDRSAVASLTAFAWLRRHGYAAELRSANGPDRAVRLFLDGTELVATPSAHDDATDE